MSARWAYGLLAAVVAWVVVAAPEPLAVAWVKVQSHDVGAGWRFAMAVVALLLAVVCLLTGPRWRPLALGTALLLLFAGAVEWAVRGTLDGDEMIHLHQSWLFGSGLVPYRDFFQTHQVAWPLLTSPLVHAMNDNLDVLRWLRGIMVLNLVALLAVAGRMAQRFGASGLVVGICLLSMLTFVFGTTQFRPDPPATLALLLGLLAVLDERWVLGGVFTGVALLLGQKSVVPAAMLGVAMVAAGDRPRAWLTYALAMLPPIGVGFLWAAVRGVLSDYTLFTWIMPFFYVNKYKTRGATTTHAIATMHQESLMHPVVGILALVGLVLLWREGRKGRLLAVATCLTVAVQLALNLGYTHYISYPTVLVCLAAAVACARVQQKDGLTAAVPTFAVLLIAFMGLVRMAAWPPAGLDMDRARLVLAHVPPGGTYWADDVAASPIFRRDADYCYWSEIPTHDLLKQMGRDDHPMGEVPSPPPDVIVIGDPQRRQRVLDLLRQEGAEYEAIGPGILARIRPGEPLMNKP